jgi:flagellar biosynthesis/type III secretory pathway protein FliH
MKLTSILAAAVLSLGSFAVAAQAQVGATLQPVQYGYNSYDRHEQHEYESGYKDGSHSGMKDARNHRGFLLYDHGSYRDHRDPEYREGFERGYREAYRANSFDRDHDRYVDHERY